jgi:putative PIN family toxin of toxin-antitoxin system
VRIVFDTNILVRTFISPRGPANEALEAILAGNHRLLLSIEILQESMRVLRKPLMSLLHGKTEDDLYGFRVRLLQNVEMVLLNPLLTGPVRDPNDIVILQTTLSGNADAICTFDRDFFTPPASDFLALRKIAVLTDAQLLQRLRQ